MPISVVIGGQFGSEGKGKVALELVRCAKNPAAVVRVGGPNSGHTAYDNSGQRYVLRQFPAACIDRDVDVILPAGAYIDVEVFLSELDALAYPPRRVQISPYARIITDEHKSWEQNAGLVDQIGSTGSGVGAAVIAAVARGSRAVPLQAPLAQDIAPLGRYLSNTSLFLRDTLNSGHRVIIEGTQGFGLSLLEGGYWPKATSRITTASGALAEAGLSPLDVDEVVLVIRSFPIRVAGDSGPLPNETTWDKIAAEMGTTQDIREYTSVTGRLRRVATFDSELVKQSIIVNNPTRIVMNHLDYIGTPEDLLEPESKVSVFLNNVENAISREIDWIGFSPYRCFGRSDPALLEG